MMRRASLTLAVLAVALAVAGPSTGLGAPPHPQFKATVKYAQVGDVTLAYYTRGKGTPLLMINGFISTMGLWDPALLDELARHHQLILFDNRGVGLPPTRRRTGRPSSRWPTTPLDGWR